MSHPRNHQHIQVYSRYDQLFEGCWSPKDDWYFSEYFGPTFQFVQEVPDDCISQPNYRPD
jgi:hypothetical protein